MTAYLVITYDVTNPERLADYNPGKAELLKATIAKHGGAVVAGGPTEVTDGNGTERCVLLSFPDADAAKAWQNDDDYAPAKAIRLEATTNVTELIVEGR